MNPDCMKPVELSIEEYEKVRAEPTRFVVAPGDEHVIQESSTSFSVWSGTG